MLLFVFIFINKDLSGFINISAAEGDYEVAFFRVFKYILSYLLKCVEPNASRDFFGKLRGIYIICVALS